MKYLAFFSYIGSHYHGMRVDPNISQRNRKAICDTIEVNIFIIFTY